jgi:hypothetical protein
MGGKLAAKAAGVQSELGRIVEQVVILERMLVLE